MVINPPQPKVLILTREDTTAVAIVSKTSLILDFRFSGYLNSGNINSVTTIDIISNTADKDLERPNVYNRKKLNMPVITIVLSG